MFNIALYEEMRKKKQRELDEKYPEKHTCQWDSVCRKIRLQCPLYKHY
jgi:hypothetical protein